MSRWSECIKLIDTINHTDGEEAGEGRTVICNLLRRNLIPGKGEETVEVAVRSFEYSDEQYAKFGGKIMQIVGVESRGENTHLQLSCRL
jgi:hypothetical protein